MPADDERRLAIYCGPGWERWSPADLEARGLGGSETAAVRLAEALARLRWQVTVYAECDASRSGAVAYAPWQAFDPAEPRACVIASRLPELFDAPVAAGLRVLWVHDRDCAGRLTPERAARLDACVALSRWHAGHLRATYPYLAPKLVTLRNGIAPELFAPRPWRERSRRVLCSSAPDRGLECLLAMWPSVRARVPDATLCWCHPEVYRRMAERVPRIAAQRARLRRLLAGAEGVIELGSLGQPALARLMCDTRVWAHPSYSALRDEPFHETSCIGAVEAQAAGCHVVASRWGALPETVRVGTLVDGPALSPGWTDGFVDAIAAGLADEATGDAAVRRGPRAVRGLDWHGVAERVSSLVRARVPAARAAVPLG